MFNVSPKTTAKQTHIIYLNTDVMLWTFSGITADTGLEDCTIITAWYIEENTCAVGKYFKYMGHS